MKTWIKRKDGSVVKYSLNKEMYPVWYATVFMYDGRWTFEYGKRIKEGDPSREYHRCASKWRSLQTAKAKALHAISVRINNY